MKHVPESRRCGRGCCWTNFAVCARKYACRCHAPVTGIPPRLTLDDLLAQIQDGE